MKDLKYAALRYCPLLGHNVVMEGKKTDSGTVLSCLNKADCGYCEKGCRNLLLNGCVLSERTVMNDKTSEPVSAEVG